MQNSKAGTISRLPLEPTNRTARLALCQERELWHEEWKTDLECLVIKGPYESGNFQVKESIHVMCRNFTNTKLDP